MFESREWEITYHFVAAKIVPSAHLLSYAIGKGGVFLWGKAVGKKG